MFRFVKQIFISAKMFFNSNVLNVNSLECVSVSYQECNVRPEIININSNEPLFYPNSVKINKCGDSCNNLSDSYARLCVPAFVKNINLKVFNLMSRTNETRYIKLHKTCKCKCRLDASVCNNKQRWNARVNVKHLLIKTVVIKDLFGILVIVNVNVINNVMLENI